MGSHGTRGELMTVCIFLGLTIGLCSRGVVLCSRLAACVKDGPVSRAPPAVRGGLRGAVASLGHTRSGTVRFIFPMSYLSVLL